jgi:hypothetical protein
MPSYQAGFSERVFEFAFNSEYAHRNKAVLAGAPHIPTQNEEKWLGYDVAFEVKQRGGAVHAVALQHKVSRFVDKVGPSNRHFWSAAGGPYFAFVLDTDQYNLIQSISSCGVVGIEFHYCAPIFFNRNELNTHYLAKTVESNSIWIDVGTVGQITDTDTHTIVYPALGGSAFRFSKTAMPLNVISPNARDAAKAGRKNVKLDDIETIYEVAFGALENYWSSRRPAKKRDANNTFQMPRQLPKRQAPTLVNTGKLLGQYFGMSLLVEVHK